MAVTEAGKTTVIDPMRAKNINPAGGLSYLFQGLSLVTRPGIRPFVIVPLLINIAVFALGIGVAWEYLGGLSAWLREWLPDWLDWLATLLIPLFIVTVLTLVFFLFSIVANLLASPFNGLLAEKVEQHLTGRPLPDGGTGNLMVELPKTLWDELSKVVYALLWSVPFLLLFLVPVVNVVAPFLWLAFSAWIMAVQYVDFPMGNHGFKGREMRRRLASRRVTSLGFGGGVLAMTSIPVVNFFAMPVAVAGATAFWLDRLADDAK